MLKERNYSAFTDNSEFLKMLYADYPDFFTDIEMGDSNVVTFLKVSEHIGFINSSNKLYVYNVIAMPTIGGSMTNCITLTNQPYGSLITTYETESELVIWVHKTIISAQLCITISKNAKNGDNVGNAIIVNCAGSTTSAMSLGITTDFSNDIPKWVVFNSRPAYLTSMPKIVDYSSDTVLPTIFLNCFTGLDFTNRCIKFIMNGKYYIGNGVFSVEYIP